jgi:hypothetical protein
VWRCSGASSASARATGFDASGRREAAQLIDRCFVFRQGISRRLTPLTDAYDTEG